MGGNIFGTLILRQLSTLHFSPILTLTIWGAHRILLVKGLV
jgi:hypothetical protein